MLNSVLFKGKSVNIQDWAETSFFSTFREAGHFCIVLVCVCLNKTTEETFWLEK